ncbi:hypothetical protein K2Y11_12325 [bacterium]|nr:hypothetical protein [bacterium]
MCRSSSIVLLLLIVMTAGCGSAASNNQSPIASEAEIHQSQEEISRREAQAQADEAEFFRRKGRH